MAESTIKRQPQPWRRLSGTPTEVTTAATYVDIPQTATEILVVVGSKNGSSQVYGGKSYVLPDYGREWLIIQTGTIYNGAGTVVSNKGIRIYWQNDKLLLQATDIVSGYVLIAYVYYKPFE